MNDHRKIGRGTTDAQLARIFADAMRASGHVPPSHLEIEQTIDRTRELAKNRPERKRGVPSHAQARAVEARRDQAAEPIRDELPIDERRGLALGARSGKKEPAPRTAQGTPDEPGTNRKRRRFLASLAVVAPRLRLRDWSSRIVGRARQIGASAVEAERACAELPRVLSIRVRRAALGIRRGASSWVASRSWRSIYARRCVAYAWAVYRMSVQTKRRGYERLCLGVSQGMIAALVVNPQTLRSYSRAGVAATRSGATGEGCGPLAALERAGVWYAEQPPADVTPIELVGPSGHAVQHYWITERSCSPLADAAELEIADVEPYDPPARPFNSSGNFGVHGGADPPEPVPIPH